MTAKGKWRLVWEFDWPNDHPPNHACFAISYDDPPLTRGPRRAISFGQSLNTAPSLGKITLVAAQPADGTADAE